jgi:tripartite-type tricarboxylate transporter receptor subunit TctC
MHSPLSKISRAVALAAAVVAAALSPACAQSANTGQPITLIISSGQGGGYDTYGRLVARHLGRFLPGQPAVVPKNMPGAGSIAAANWLFNIAPKDGTAIGILQNGTALEPLLRHDQARFDARRFNWLASLNRLVNIAVVWHEAPFHSARDLFTKELIVGGSGGGGDNTTVMPRLLNSLVGTKFKVITGYTGTNSISLAMERGEVQGLVGTSWDSLKATKPDWIAEHKVRVPLQISFEKHPELPNVASVVEFIKNDEDRRLLEMILARQVYGRPFVAPPEMPLATVRQLRDAFARMAVDKEFLADAEKLRLEIIVNSGDEIAALIERIYKSRPALVERAIGELKKAGAL